jgi:putative hydroxymethylpyrimidine transport system substrate-binding protein
MGAASWRTPARSPLGLAAAITTTLALALAGCGGDDATVDGASNTPAQTTAPVDWTLVLDYEPNAVHAGLLRAQAAGYFKDAGINLKVIAPSSTSDALTQVSRGRAELGLADLIDVARRNERAYNRVAHASEDGTSVSSGPPKSSVPVVGAIVQRPLSGLIVNADGPIKEPAQLAGKKIAVSGLPSDVAVINAMVQSGGKPLPTDQITLGFNGLKAVDAGRVEASTAYWPADEVSLEQLGTPARSFALDEYGGPEYPGLVAFTSAKLQATQAAKLKAFDEALAHGTRDVIADPALGETAVGDAYPELDPTITKKQLANYLPLFGTASTAGKIDAAALESFTAFAAKAGLTTAKLTPGQLTASTAPTPPDATEAAQP